MKLKQKNNFIFATLLSCIYSVNATEIPLNPDFGDQGKVITIIGGDTDNSRAFSVTATPAGTLVAAGYTEDAGTDVFAITRYASNGRNVLGITTRAVGSSGSRASGVTTLNENIITVGSASDNGADVFALVRFDENGNWLSTTTIQAGVIESTANAVVTNNTTIFAVGTALSINPNTDFALVRFDESGNWLSTTTTLVGDERSEARAVAVQQDGTIVVAGEAQSNGTGVFALVFYNPNGSWIKTVTTAVGLYDSAAYGIIVQADNSLVLVGQARDDTNTNGVFGVALYDANGVEIDTVLTDVTPGEDSEARSVVLANDGQSFYAAGNAAVSGAGRIAVVQYDKNGTFLASAITLVGLSSSNADGVTILPNNTVVAAGSGRDTSGGTRFFALAGYGESSAPVSTDPLTAAIQRKYFAL